MGEPIERTYLHGLFAEMIISGGSLDSLCGLGAGWQPEWLTSFYINSEAIREWKRSFHWLKHSCIIS